MLQFVEGADPGDRFGWSVRGVGDMDGDGAPDLVVGSYHDKDASGMPTGSATVLSGRDGSVIHKVYNSMPSLLGMSVGGGGDVNGDGVPDFIAGVPTVSGATSGSVFVYSGIDASILLSFSGDSRADRFGHSVAHAGDVDGDGFDDLIVGAPWAVPNGPNSGLARVFSGADGSVIHSFEGDTAEDRLGWSVGAAGDVDGDGFDDLIVGASADDNGGNYSGSASVYSGGDGSELHRWEGLAPLDLFGYAVGGTGDVDGDGVPDLIVGAWGEDTAGLDSGSARVFSGADGSLLHAFFGNAPGDRFGWSVAGAGDIDRDGLQDLLVGALRADGDDLDAGSVTVYSGGSGAPLFTAFGAGPNNGLGRSVSSLGDSNDDCIADVAVGAYNDDGVVLGSATILSGLQAVWSGLGSGLAGTNGVPCLSATGTLQAGAAVTLRLDSAAAGSSSYMLFGLSALYAPFKGGVLVPDIAPPGFFMVFPTGATGALAVSDTWPPGVPSGFTFYVQDWIVDATGPAGFSASHGLSGTTP